jgi:hypothetical protein
MKTRIVGQFREITRLIANSKRGNFSACRDFEAANGSNPERTRQELLPGGESGSKTSKMKSEIQLQSRSRNYERPRYHCFLLAACKASSCFLTLCCFC